MFKFYELVSKVTLKGILENDIRAYFLKELWKHKAF